MFRNYFGETVTVVLAVVMGFAMSLASVIVDRLAFNFQAIG